MTDRFPTVFATALRHVGAEPRRNFVRHVEFLGREHDLDAAVGDHLVGSVLAVLDRVRPPDRDLGRIGYTILDREEYHSAR